jgi:hypothetical protein
MIPSPMTDLRESAIMETTSCAERTIVVGERGGSEADAVMIRQPRSWGIAGGDLLLGVRQNCGSGIRRINTTEQCQCAAHTQFGRE